MLAERRHDQPVSRAPLIRHPRQGDCPRGRSRAVSIDTDTITVLREHRGKQTEQRTAAGSAWNDSGGLIFVSRWGEPLYPDTVTALMTKLIRTCNNSAAARLGHADRP